MDQELSTFLKESFSEMSRQFEASLRQETARIREEMVSLRDEVATKAEMASLREEVATKAEMASFREEVERRFDQQEETNRHTRVLVEDVYSTVQLMAEGFMGLNQRVDRYHKETELSFQQVHKWMRPYFEELSRQNQDLTYKHEELERKNDAVDGRVRSLEDHSDRRFKDAMEGVRAIIDRHRREDAERAAAG